jgi:hypothetical protein
MPADFPPWDRVCAFFRRWRDHWLVKEFHDRLRAAIRESRRRPLRPPDAHPPPRPATPCASVNRPGATSASRPRVTRRFA